MKILVTGASGHIGYHICNLLVSKGYQVKAFIRPSSFKEHLSRLPLSICYGDILKLDTLVEAMKGIEAVFHTAAIYRLSGEKGDGAILKTATEGTKNIYRAARGSSVKKIVYTSSVETIGSSYDKHTFLSESNFASSGMYTYSAAKIESEKIALALAKDHNVPTVICNPSTVIGKEDYKLTPSNKMLLNFVRHNSFYVDGGLSLVNVEDVAEGHVNALLKGRDSERYILSGENIEIKDLIILIRRILKAKKPLFKLNKSILYPAACLFEAISKVTGSEMFITRRKVAEGIGRYSYYDCSKAKRELGYRPREIAATLPDTLEWLQK